MPYSIPQQPPQQVPNMPYSIPPQYSYGTPNPVAPVSPEGIPSPHPMTKEELHDCIRQIIVESIPGPRTRSIMDYCKLPPVNFPPGFKVPKYRKYDGTSDPSPHLSGFVMDSHQFLHDRALLVHLFQKSLEGEALGWFISLSTSELTSFDIVAQKFTDHFSYLAPQIPTLTDLVNEKMKPDEDFKDFANRWGAMACKSGIQIPKTQAIAMMVHNATPQLRSILMLSEITTVPQLYSRAKIIQAQIRESAMPLIIEQAPEEVEPLS